MNIVKKTISTLLFATILGLSVTSIMHAKENKEIKTALKEIMADIFKEETTLKKEIKAEGIKALKKATKKGFSQAFDYGKGVATIILAYCLKHGADSIRNEDLTLDKLVLFYGLEACMILSTVTSVLSIAKPLTETGKDFKNLLLNNTKNKDRQIRLRNRLLRKLTEKNKGK